MTAAITRRKSGFTLIEIMIVAICLAIVMGPIYMILTAGTQSSLTGMMRIETTLEARRALKQIYADLKMACFPMPYSHMYDFSDVMAISGSPPFDSYHFLSFPIHASVADVMTSPGFGENFREVAEITYKVEADPDPGNPFMLLVREVNFDGKTSRRVLSNRVNFFSIKPIPIQPQGRLQFYFAVTLQLIDTLKPHELAAMSSGSKIGDLQQHVILADFFEVVYPEYFHAMWNQIRVQPNWHTPLRGPEAN